MLVEASVANNEACALVFRIMTISNLKVTPRTKLTDMITVKNKMHFVTIAILLLLSSCDPVHHLKLENKTNKRIEVIFYPALDTQNLGDKEVIKINFSGRESSSVILDSAETIRIGTVTARYNPRPNDIDVDYLEIRMQADTLRLIGKTAIFTTIQKVEKLDWRLIIRSE